MKRSAALLGSNRMRNNAVMRRRKMGGPGGRSFYLRIAIRCQEKPTDESSAAVFIHAAVRVEVLLQVGENPLDLIVGLGHSGTIGPLVGEQVWTVEVDAVHGCAQPPVRVPGLPRRLGYRPPLDGAVPALFPLRVVLAELAFSHQDKVLHQLVELTGCQQSRVQCKIPPDNLSHVELAHLDGRPLKELEQAASAINDDAAHLIPAALNAS